MKRPLLAFAVVFAGIPAFSQITISSSDMMNAGDSVRVSYAASTSVDHTLSGANYLWDFSSLVPTAQEELHFNAPTALPFNFLSTIAVLNPSPDSLPFIGSVPNNFTNYFKNSSGGYRQNGISFEYAPLGNFSVPVIFTSSDYIYKFPLDYTDMDTSDAAYSFNIPNLAYIGETIHRENNVDGWGTLVTPYGTFQCLRVVSHVFVTDTIGLDSVNGFSTPRPEKVEYKWLAQGKKIPVLEIDAQMAFNNEVISNIIYQDSLRPVFQVGMAETAQTFSDVAVYPNPASGNCVITYTSSEFSKVKLLLSDVSGREIRDCGEQFSAAGNHSTNINLEGIAPGMYFVSIISGNSKITRRLVVTN